MTMRSTSANDKTKVRVSTAIRTVMATFVTSIGLAIVHFARSAAIPSMVYDGMPYLVVGALLVYVLRPHPTATSPPLINESRLANCNSSAVDYKRIIFARTPATHNRYCVIGAGFVGKRLIHTLLMRGEKHIVVFDMDPHACDAFKANPRVKFIRGNVTDYDQVYSAVKDSDVCFSTFAIIRFMDRLEHQAALSYNINVIGTENVVKACQKCNVQVLVQTSTSNVALQAKTVSLHMDEKADYVTRSDAPNHYGWSKAISEQLVLRAASSSLRTAAIRPCSAVFGAEDRHLLDSMLKLGRTPLPPNGGNTVLDFIPVDNVVFAHLLAEKGLLENPSQVNGEAFCVSNSAPMRLRDFVGLVDRIRPGGMMAIPTPQVLLKAMAYTIEFAKFLRLPVPRALDQLTGCTVEFLEISYAFNSRKAFDLLDYRPLFTVEQGIDLAVKEWLSGKVEPAFM